jgi:hypothetical protein
VPTGISVITWFVELLITATLLEYRLVTKRDWAKAEDAKAKARIINSKGRRYVFIVFKGIGLRPYQAIHGDYVKPNLWKPSI